MLDNSLPSLPLMMEKKDAAIFPEIALPRGYFFEFYRDGYENEWAELMAGVAQFESREDALRRFTADFLSDRGEAKRRCLFVRAPGGGLAGVASLWTGEHFGEPRPMIHWVAVADPHTGRGIAKAMMTRLLRLNVELGHTYVFLTSRTRNWQALGIYLTFGFVPYMGPKPANWGPEDFETEMKRAWDFVREMYEKNGRTLKI